MSWQAIIVAVLSLIGTLGGAWLVGRGNAKTKRAETEAAPYAELAKRVTDLEKSDEEKRRRIGALEHEVEDLRQERATDRAWIARVIDWLTIQHLELPFPHPDWYTTDTRKDT